MTDLSSIGIALITFITFLTVTLKYRRDAKKYKTMYEKLIKKPEPPHTSEKAVRARTDLQRWLEIRSQILLRDHFRCRECNYYKHLEVHHIIPKSKGGTDDPENLITLCTRCHAKKHGFKRRESKRKCKNHRNKRKKFKRYLKENARNIRNTDYPVQSLEDVHPHQEDLSPEAIARRQENYKKWENNQLNQT